MNEKLNIQKRSWFQRLLKYTTLSKKIIEINQRDAFQILGSLKS